MYKDNKTIVWLTGDYFLDSDMLIVPELKKKYSIWWIILRSYNSKIDISLAKTADEVLTMKHRNRSLLSAFFELNVIKKIMRINPKILYLDYLGMPYFYPLLTKLFDTTKVVFMAHNVAPRPTWNWFLRFYYPYIFKHLQHIHIPSTHNISYIKNNYPNLSYTYIPMVVKSFGKANVVQGDGDKTRFLFFGHVMTNKHLDHLIEAYCGLSDEDKMKSELLVYGKCMHADYYENMAKGEKNIHLHFGYVPNEKIPELFSISSYLVLPYDNVDQSGPSMIAFNYNLPLICSDIEGFKEIVNDGKDGFLYKKNNVAELREVLHRCINMKESEYFYIKRNQKEMVNNNYTLEVVSRKYCDMFDKILRK